MNYLIAYDLPYKYSWHFPQASMASQLVNELLHFYLLHSYTNPPLGSGFVSDD